MITVEKLNDMSPGRRKKILTRSMEDVSSVFLEVRETINEIREKGDTVAIGHYRKYKDDISAEDLKAGPEEFEEAYARVDQDVIDALKFAAENIRKFHQAQLEKEMWSIEIAPGIIAGRVSRPLDIVGAYVPGRRAAYPSSVLMNIIPAHVAKVPRIVVTTPPGEGMTVVPEVLVAADIAGAEAVYKIGGPWAIGSLAVGTATVPKVDKIVGPGNRWVTAAKMVVFGQVGIDSPAGPSEALILADDTADPGLLVYDFFSQLEHDPDAAAVMVTPSPRLAEATAEAINDGLETIPRREIIEVGLRNNSAVIVTDTMEQAIDFTNEYAAEHLQIITADPWAILPRIKHAGSIFMGPWAPVPAGDYGSGTNHVLPTGQCARMFSGLSVDDFIKKPTYQYLTKEGLGYLKDAIITLAEAEGLPVHAETIRQRFKEEALPKLIFKTFEKDGVTYCGARANGDDRDDLPHKFVEKRNGHGHEPGYVYLAYLPKGKYKGCYKIGKVERKGVGKDDFNLDKIENELLERLEKRLGSFNPGESSDKKYTGAKFVHGIRVACGEGAEKQPHSFFREKTVGNEVFKLSEVDIEVFKTATGKVLGHRIKHLTAEEFADYLESDRGFDKKTIRNLVALPENWRKD
ncbi:MAG: histidinol dehydrogenase [Deltaproteobacteria bacterium]|nr:histidinol dehydrogenase [Deltaproteobacteria bacterium]